MPRKLMVTLQALELLGRDCMKDMQELADEAFRDLLTKHGRRTSLKEALRRSAGESENCKPNAGMISHHGGLQKKAPAADTEVPNG